MEEIDAESGGYGSSGTLFLPVGSEGIEVVPVKIHHGEQHVVNFITEPPLGILVNGIASVPAAR